MAWHDTNKSEVIHAELSSFDAANTASQVEKSPRLNWTTQFLTVVYDDACSPMFLSEWREFLSAPCFAGGKKSLMKLASLCYWNRARRLTCFLSASVTRKACNSAHEQTLLSNDTIDSALRHREVGRAKDLSAPPCKCVQALKSSALTSGLCSIM